jgi:hypothetical protein
MKICEEDNKLKPKYLEIYIHYLMLEVSEETNMKELEYVSVRERKINQVNKDRRC